MTWPFPRGLLRVFVTTSFGALRNIGISLPPATVGSAVTINQSSSAVIKYGPALAGMAMGIFCLALRAHKKKGALRSRVKKPGPKGRVQCSRNSTRANRGTAQVARSLWGRCAWAVPLFARVELRLH